MRLVPLLTAAVSGASFAILAWAQAPADLDMFAKILAEGMERSHADATFAMLTSNIGPRLTASPAHKRAAEWARSELSSYGLENAHLEAFPFGRGWTMDKLTIEMVEPRYLPLIGYADGWSAATAGEITLAPLWLGNATAEQVAASGDTITGSIAMTEPILTNFIRADRPQPSDAAYVANSAAYATSVGRTNNAGANRAPTRAQLIAQTLKDKKAGVILRPSRGEHGTVFVTGRDQGPGAVPSITLSGEHYNMIAGMLEQKIPVKLRVNLQTTFYDNDNGNTYNVLAEMPGSDPVLKDEVVMIGAHLDSWHTGVGATDNADGSTTVMEAMRILKAVDAHPKRTIRVALWSGEEQGLLGSKAWVAQHLTGAANAEFRKKINVYFNIDNGTGPVYGWYLQNSEASRSIFDAWLSPWKEYGARKNTIEPIGSTDHLTFIDLGIPGFNPIQDYVNYDVREHHTNMDTVDRLQLQDIHQAASVFAWFAYKAANDSQRVPSPGSK
jgi:hypothetical protein